MSNQALSSAASSKTWTRCANRACTSRARTGIAPGRRSGERGWPHADQYVRQQLPRPVGRMKPSRRPATPLKNTATACRRCASSAAPRPCTRTGAGDLQIPRHRRHHPVRGRLRRQRRRVRAAVRRERRHHLGRAEPRVDHRRHPPVQGRALPLRPQRHGRPGSAAAGRRRQAPQESSSPTACSRWTAPSPSWTRSATWPTSTARW
jgi:hypothetical protein